MPKALKSITKNKTTNDLFGATEPKGRASLKVASRSAGAEAGYTARDIEVLEGLEPVRRRPGMYIGGTDEKALHHLFAEVIDNSMDEALAGHATFIEVELSADGFLTVTDNGRGIPVDPHPKFPKKSALEVIMCTLHSGGKFDSKVYETSGGLHGVGVSVVNALSSRLEVEVARGQKLYRMAFERGQPKGKLEDLGKINNRRGTKIRFKPDAEIFGAKATFKPQRLFKMARSKAYLFGGVEIRWRCDPALSHDAWTGRNWTGFYIFGGGGGGLWAADSNTQTFREPLSRLPATSGLAAVAGSERSVSATTGSTAATGWPAFSLTDNSATSAVP